MREFASPLKKEAVADRWLFQKRVGMYQYIVRLDDEAEIVLLCTAGVRSPA